MKDKKPLDWIPLFIDKHLFGSTRLELKPDERSVWMDLLVLSGKDSGHIRANKEVPYLSSQLAGLLVIPEELLIRTIDKCKTKKINKIEILNDGTMYLPSWKEYRLSPRHKRRFMSESADIVSEEEDTEGETEDTIEREREEKKKKEEKEKEALILLWENEFESIWENYHPDGKKNRTYAKKRFLALCKKGELENFKKGLEGYVNFLEFKSKKENFEQRVQYFSTFCTNYKEYIQYCGHKIGPNL